MQRNFNERRSNDNRHHNTNQVPEIVKKSFKRYNYPELIKSIASEVAKEMDNEKKASRDKLNKNTQIRKFFDDLYVIKSKIDSSDNPQEVFEKNLPLIYLVASKCAYARGRKHVGEAFYTFITSNVLEIETLSDFNTFISYFEAILGYYRYLNPSEN
ncbi:MAG: CRISPR-associated protein Csm2 [Deferribacteres bacterium]|nr:CRISPR-associated protein domain protein [Deferribacteraceae bacterium]MDK2792949.1 CRISPR-associated protein Csm2 [Deferribacteres bacterium]